MSGEKKTGQQFVDDLMYGDKSKISLNGSGGQTYGGGIYMATNSNPKKGRIPSEKAQYDAADDSKYYGNGNSADRQMQITLSPNAKVGIYKKVYSEFTNESPSIKQKFGYDIGAYAAAKGYDALRSVNGGWGCDYTMVYNRTALIICDEILQPFD